VLRQQVARLQATSHNPALDRFRADPARVMADAGLQPDRWQAELLRSHSLRMLLLCSRQSGKSMVAGALALREALLNPPALVLLLSPSQRQSGELFKDKVRRLYNALARPVACVQETALTMELANGSRIIALPGEEETIRCYSGVRLIAIDEAARVPDDLYRSVRPMLAVSGGRLVCLSTPFGQRGFFHEEWERGEGWSRTRITALQCPRIRPEFLREEKRTMGPRFFGQEYLTDFAETTGAVFAADDIAAAMDNNLTPLFAGSLP